MITQDAFIIGKSLIVAILQKFKGINKTRHRFIIHILMLYLSHRGRINFLQMKRQGGMNEKSYRNQYDKPFDWLTFNAQYVEANCGDEIVIGFDPSFISKSGKHSHGLGYFYSGCSNQYKRGLEIGSFAAIDIGQNTAYHLLALQTPSAKRDRINENRTLIDCYGDLIVERSLELEEVSKILVCDAYFSKNKYVDKVCNKTNFEFICRLRDDANLRYIYNGSAKKGRGRPRKYSGKIDVKNIDKRRIKLVYSDNTKKIYTAIVNSVGLKRNIKLCYVEFILSNGNQVNKLFYSTNLERCAIEILKYYQGRYQMEFIFRDAKQYAGLEQFQGRSENKLNFHFNASLTSISIGKGIIRNTLKNNKSIPLSIRDVKTELQNRNMLFRIFSIYGFSHKLIKINKIYKQVMNLGKIAA
jgi:hypothetical protein